MMVEVDAPWRSSRGLAAGAQEIGTDRRRAEGAQDRKELTSAQAAFHAVSLTENDFKCGGCFYSARAAVSSGARSHVDLFRAHQGMLGIELNRSAMLAPRLGNCET